MTDSTSTLVGEFAAAADGLLKMTLSKDAVRTEAHTTPHSPALWAAAASAGWFDAVLDSDSGGAGLDLEVLSGLFEALGRHLAAGPFLDNVALVPLIFTEAGSDLREQLAPATRGERLIVVADPAAANQTSNTPVLENGSLSGNVNLVRYAPEAEGFLVVCSTTTGEAALVYVDAAAAGVRVVSRSSVDPVSSYGTIEFDAAPIAETHRIESPGTAALVDDVRAVARIALARELVGASRHMLDAAVEYAGQREQFGKPIGAFQPVQQILSSMTTDVLMAEALSAAAAHRMRAGVIDSGYADTAKLYASEVARRVGESSLQVHGGIAFTAEFDLHRWFLHILALQSTYGDESELGQHVGHQLLDGTLIP